MADATSSKSAKRVTAKRQSSNKSAPKKTIAKEASAKKPAAPKLTTKSTAKGTKATKKAAKVSAPKVIAKGTRKSRGYRKIKIAGFEEIMKKKAELALVTLKAKKQLQKEYAKAIAQAEAINVQYQDLFDEPIKAMSKKTKRGSGKARKTGVVAPISKEEVESFIEQKEQGLSVTDIKIVGRRPQSIQKIDAAYGKADTKDAPSVLTFLK